MSGRPAGGSRVAALARLRRVEAGLVEQLAAVRAAIDDLEGLKAEGGALPGSGLLTVEETASVLRASRSRASSGCWRRVSSTVLHRPLSLRVLDVD